VHARRHGAEEVYVAIAPNLDSDRRFLRLSGDRPLGRRFAIRATVAYKGSWARRTKTYSQDSKDRLAIERADTWFQALAGRISPSRPFHDQVASAAAGLPSAKLIDWLAEAPVGTRPLAVVDSSAAPSETFAPAPALILTVALTIENMAWCGACLVGTVA